MVPTRFFHQIDGNVHELPDRGPFRYERELQKFFEEHLHTLTGVEFLASEYSTGPRHGRRIDTLGIDGAGRPVVVEYKRRQDQNVITQGLDYLVWLEDHQAEFRELLRTQLGDGRVTDIDFGASRLLCIAEGFPRQDQIAAANSRRPIELLRYRRYGDAYVALEWVYGAAPARNPVARRGPLSRDEFLESCDDHGRAVYSKILALADFEDMSLKWDTTSFKIVVDVDGSQVPVCTAGLPGSKFGQAVWTTRGSDKAGTPADVFEQLRREAQQTGLFVPAGKELKCSIDHVFTNDEVHALFEWCVLAEQAIREHAVPACSRSG